MEKVKKNAVNMMELEQPSRLKGEWEERKKKEEEQIKFWEENKFISFTSEEIDKKIYNIVPIRFISANKNQIDAKILNLCETFFKLEEGLYLWGKPGVGKTYLCASLIREYYFRCPKRRKWYGDDKKYAEYICPPDPYLITVPDLFFEIKSSFGKKDGRLVDWGDYIPKKEMSESQIIEKYSEIEVLFLDDIGTEKTTDWAQQTLYTIIDRRYREKLQTTITSNLSLNELSDKTGDRITSRIAEMCKIIELKGKDRRLK